MCVDTLFFFFNDTATTEIYTLSLHDALPISSRSRCRVAGAVRLLTGRRSYGPATRCIPPAARWGGHCVSGGSCQPPDRKSTRLNSSHANISYAVFCLKKKKKN